MNQAQKKSQELQQEVEVADLSPQEQKEVEREMAMGDALPKIRTIGVLTSGGDAPGMNAAIRAVTRAALNKGFEVFGVRRGYHGLWRGDLIRLNGRSVSEKLQRGGTFLMTARSKSFNTPEGVRKGYEMAKVFNLDALVVIGGDGSFRGARDLSREGLPVICIPGTIDNDIACTDYTIGYDTAMNTAMEAIDKLKDTAAAHERCSVIEVMGRHAGYIALNVGVAVGAEVILLPEIDFDFNKDVVKRILDCRNEGKYHYVVVMAEGAGSAAEVAEKISQVTGIEAKATILGHIQRGGSPTLRDRIMASNMGAQAVECLVENRVNRIVCFQNGQVTDIDLEEGLAAEKNLSVLAYERSKIIAL